MPVQVIIDDSGTRGTGTYLVLLALIAESERWMSFSDEWKTVLHAAPRIKYFKMSEAIALKGEFHFCRDDARDDKVLRLARIIERHAPLVSYSYVDLQAFEDIVTPAIGKHVVGKSSLNHPFLFAAQNLLYALIGEEARTKGRRIEVIFDEQEVFNTTLSGSSRRMLSLFVRLRLY